MRNWIAGAASVVVLGSASLALADGAADWPSYNYDARGTRFNAGERTLSRGNVGGLHQIWNVTTPAPVTATPAVVGNDVLVGDWSGLFYKLNATNGHIDWQTQLPGSISASALATEDTVIFGDLKGTVRALDRGTGAVRWATRPNPHEVAAIYSSPTKIGRNIVIGIASDEEAAAAFIPGYECCSFRGSVAMLDARDGHIVWQTYMISDAERAAGSSGAGVWVTPTYDAQLNLIYVATGNNYSEPANGKSDAVIALDADTGAIRWVNQRVENDVSNFTYPVSPNLDNDFGDSVDIYRLANGRKVVGSGNKNGVFWVFDAATGEALNHNQFQPGGSLGGLFADSAVAYNTIFANGSYWPDPFDFSALPNMAYLTAISPDAQQVRWQFTVPERAALSGVAVANEVVYFTALNPGTGDRVSNDGGTLYALDAFSGAQLAALPLAHCANGGPAVANGRIFVGLGNELQFTAVPPGNIVAFGL